ncbi:MAG: hypothetical protein K6G52_07600 [Treponemataceae bacterium]|nr:hypothetical protein [Treponemataceae bacterium]
MKALKKTFILGLMVLVAASAFAQDFASEYEKMKAVVYNDLVAKEAEVLAAYDAAAGYVTNDVESAQIDFLAGLFYMNSGNKEKAGEYYTNSLAKSKGSYDKNPTAEAYCVYAEALSQNCTVQSTGYMVSNGTKVPNFAKKALALDPKCAGASYSLACYSIYAPAPFCNLKKGLKILDETIKTSKLDTDDLFNYYSTYAYVALKQKNTSLADEWLAKAAEIYPNNSNLKMLQKHEFKTYGEDIDTSSANAAE